MFIYLGLGLLLESWQTGIYSDSRMHASAMAVKRRPNVVGRRRYIVVCYRRGPPYGFLRVRLQIPTTTELEMQLIIWFNVGQC